MNISPVFIFTDQTLCVLEIAQTAALDGVRLWDLRKLKNFRTFDFPNANSGIQLAEHSY